MELPSSPGMELPPSPGMEPLSSPSNEDLCSMYSCQSELSWFSTTPNFISLQRLSPEVDAEEEFGCAAKRDHQTLPCGHPVRQPCDQQIVCEPCDQHIVNGHEGNDDAVLCPEEVSPVPERGRGWDAPGSRNNETALGAEGQLLTAGGERTTVTEVCEECRVGRCRYSCLFCQRLVCDSCLPSHTSDDHQLLLLPSLDLPTSVASERCQKHRLNVLNHFCQTCNEALCQLCTGTRDHDNHKTLHITKAGSQAKVRLTEAKLNVERCVRRLQVTHEDLIQQKQSFLRESEETEDSIRQRAAEARNLVDQQESQALAALKDKVDKVENKLTADAISIKSKLAAVLLMLKQVDRVLQSDINLELVRTYNSSIDTISKASYFNKFTDDLPNKVFHVQMECDDSDTFAQSAEAYIGHSVVQKATQRTPWVGLVDRFNFPDKRKIDCVCPASCYRAWLAYRDDEGSTEIALLNLKNAAITKRETVKGRVILTKMDDHGIVLLQYRHFKKLMFVDGEETELPLGYSHNPLHNMSTLLTNKGPIRCCLFHRILPDGQTRISVRAVTSGLETLGSLEAFSRDPKDAIIVPDLDHILSMDVSLDQNVMAVVDRNNVLRLYQRLKSGRKLEMKTVKVLGHGNGISDSVHDVCFYRLGQREVLLLADATLDDVVVLDLDVPAFTVLGLLADGNGTLRHPSSLQVDPSNGHLLVACAEGSVVVMGDTGVQIGTR